MKEGNPDEDSGIEIEPLNKSLALEERTITKRYPDEKMVIDSRQRSELVIEHVPRPPIQLVTPV